MPLFILHLLFGKPTQRDLEIAAFVKSCRTFRIWGGNRGFSIDPEEIMASANYKEALRHVRKMEADDSWAC